MMMPPDGRNLIKATPVDVLRTPHPEQKRIDAESAALLRATALDAFRRMAAPAAGVPAATTTSRLLG